MGSYHGCRSTLTDTVPLRGMLRPLPGPANGDLGLVFCLGKTGIWLGLASILYFGQQRRLLILHLLDEIRTGIYGGREMNGVEGVGNPSWSTRFSANTAKKPVEAPPSSHLAEAHESGAGMNGALAMGREFFGENLTSSGFMDVRAGYQSGLEDPGAGASRARGHAAKIGEVAISGCCSEAGSAPACRRESGWCCVARAQCRSRGPGRSRRPIHRSGKKPAW